MPDVTQNTKVLLIASRMCNSTSTVVRDGLSDLLHAACDRDIHVLFTQVLSTNLENCLEKWFARACLAPNIFGPHVDQEDISNSKGEQGALAFKRGIILSTLPAITAFQVHDHCHWLCNFCGLGKPDTFGSLISAFHCVHLCEASAELH